MQRKSSMYKVKKQSMQGHQPQTLSVSPLQPLSLQASGKILPHYLIFKGKPNCHISMHEFSSYPDGGKYACQEKAWMNEEKMHKVIDVVLAPWKAAQDKNNISG